MEAVFLLTQIPVGKQVLMIANGEPLNPTSRVASYKSAGTVCIKQFFIKDSFLRENLLNS